MNVLRITLFSCMGGSPDDVGEATRRKGWSTNYIEQISICSFIYVIPQMIIAPSVASATSQIILQPLCRVTSPTSPSEPPMFSSAFVAANIFNFMSIFQEMKSGREKAKSTILRSSMKIINTFSVHLLKQGLLSQRQMKRRNVFNLTEKVFFSLLFRDASTSWSYRV